MALSPQVETRLSSPDVQKAEALLADMRRRGKGVADLNERGRALMRRYQEHLSTFGFKSHREFAEWKRQSEARRQRADDLTATLQQADTDLAKRDRRAVAPDITVPSVTAVPSRPQAELRRRPTVREHAGALLQAAGRQVRGAFEPTTEPTRPSPRSRLIAFPGTGQVGLDVVKRYAQALLGTLEASVAPGRAVGEVAVTPRVRQLARSLGAPWSTVEGLGKLAQFSTETILDVFNLAIGVPALARAVMRRAATKATAGKALETAVQEELTQSAARGAPQEAIERGRKVAGIRRPTPAPIQPRAATGVPVPTQGAQVMWKGDLWTVEGAGPRGIKLVDVQTGRRRVTAPIGEARVVPAAQVTQAPQVGRVIPEQPTTAPRLVLEGEEAARPAAGQQIGILGERPEIGTQGVRPKFGQPPAPSARPRGRPLEEMRLSEFVRAQGGIRPEGPLVGEIAAFTRREAGTTGLVSTKGRTATNMAELAAEAGFPIGHGEGGELLTKLADDLRGATVLSMRSVTRIEREAEKKFAASARAVERATAENLDEVRAAITMRLEGGQVRLPPSAPSSPVRFGLTPDVQRVLDMGRPGMRERLSASVARMKQGIVNYFVPEGRLIGVRTAPNATWQELRDDFRLFRDVPRVDVPGKISNDIVGVVAPLEHTEYDLFRDYVVLRDFAEEFRVAAAQGRRPSIPLGLSEEEVAENLQRLEAQLSPTIREAVVRHDRLKAGMRDEFVARGLGEVEDFREFHFRHFVIDYDQLYGGGVGIPRGRLREPFRPGLKGRTGSVKPILTDYVEVTQKELSRFYLDNAVDDFMTEIGPKIDWLPHLSGEERVRLFGKGGRPDQAGKLVALEDGTRLIVWQYHPGNRLFPGYTLDSRIIEGVTQQTLTGAEVTSLIEGAGAEGRKIARHMAILGQKYPVMLIDPQIAASLNTFNSGPGRSALFQKTNALTATWKRALVDSLGLPFQVRNQIGDLENATVLGGAGLRTPLGRALRMLAKEAIGQPLTASEAALVEQARKFRVIRSGFTSSWTKRDVLADPRLRHLQDPARRALNIPVEMLEAYERATGVREDFTRFALYLDYLERIQRGQSLPVSRVVDISGLPIERAAAKAVREAIIDYGNKSQFEEQFGQLLAPFVTWFYQNTKNWVKLGVKDPARLAAKSVPYYAAMMVWNNSGDRAEVESALPKWRRITPHIITGWTLPDGRPLIISLQTAAGSAAQVTGLARLFDLAEQVYRGDIDAEEAARRAPAEMGEEAMRGLLFQLGPGVTVPLELGVSAVGGPELDIRRGVPRIPERLEGTAAGRRKFLAEEVRALLPPVEIAARQFEARRQPPAGTTPAQRLAMATGLVSPTDPEAEARSRQARASRRATAELEDKLFAVEQAYIRSGSWQEAMKEARRQNERLGPRMAADQIRRRLRTSRVQIDRLREMIRREQDPEKVRTLRQQLDQLMRRSAQEMLKQTPKGARPFAVPKP